MTSILGSMKFEKMERELEQDVTRVVDRLRELDLLREDIIRKNRHLNRLSGRGIAALVRGDDVSGIQEEAEETMAQIEEGMRTLAPLTGWSTVNSGVEEYCEFRVFASILSGSELPSHEELGVPSWIWIVALGDVVGELRRYVLRKLLEQDFEEARKYTEVMEVIYTLIAGLEFSKAVSGSLRNKVDVARVLLERTQSDLLNSLNANNVT